MGLIICHKFLDLSRLRSEIELPFRFCQLGVLRVFLPRSRGFQIGSRFFLGILHPKRCASGHVGGDSGIGSSALDHAILNVQFWHRASMASCFFGLREKGRAGGGRAGCTGLRFFKFFAAVIHLDFIFACVSVITIFTTIFSW